MDYKQIRKGMRVKVMDVGYNTRWLDATIDGKKKSGKFWEVFVTCDKKPFTASGRNANEMIILSKTTDFSHHIKFKSPKDGKKDDIRSVADEELMPLISDRFDRHSIVEAIIDDVYNDVEETAAPKNWNDADVRIAIVRVLKERLGCPE